MPFGGHIWVLGLAVAMTGVILSGCGLLRTDGPVRPDANAASAPALSPLPPRHRGDDGPVQPRTQTSQTIQRYYQQVDTTLKARGLMRRDVAPRDAPFTQAQIVDDFMAIAMFDEYHRSFGKFVSRTTPSQLRRWEKPVRMAVEFGPTIPSAQRRHDRAMITAYAGQLARASGHSVSMVSEQANFMVFVVDEQNRQAMGPRLRQMVPGIDATTVSTFTDLPTSTFCAVFAFSQPGDARYDQAIAIIRGEHPPDLLRSCVHEELAQGLGLANDSPTARPSIFNDDEEFALLTRHDELLLKILYDPRLRPGMTEAEAHPIVTQIVAELMAGSS